MKMNYKKAGVNIDAGNEAVDQIKNEVKKTKISLEEALIMCQARGWQSFKSDWVVDKQKSFATTSYGEGEQEI